MKLRFREMHGDSQPKGRFRSACTVALDTLANKVYDFEVNRLSSLAAEAEKRYPRLSKITRHSTRLGYWGVVGAGEWMLSKKIGVVPSTVILYAHQFAVSEAIKVAAGKPSGLKDPKPKISTFTATFSLLELVSTPIFVRVVDAVAKLSSAVVSPLVAALAPTLAMLAAVAFEYPVFRLIWSRFVLRDMPKGNLSDDARGFASGFRPLRLFRFSESPGGTPTASGEYVGKIWGIIESCYLWMQGIRAAIAATIAAIFDIAPKDFAALYFASSAVILSVAGIFIGTKCRAEVEALMENGKGEGGPK